MRLLFCGTPHFAVPTLIHLLAQPEFDITAVITQPDRPRGRGRQVSPPPVKEAAVAASVPVHQPEKIRAPETQELLQRLAPDCIVIIAYGQIIPSHLLNIPKLGWINLHASLLPKYRGAAPIQWAIANGETITGVTTMRIDAGLDTGDILQQQELPIASNDTAETIAPRLAAIGADLIVETLRGLQAGTVHPRPQDNSQASLAPILKKEDGAVDFSRSAPDIFNRIRGFQPWPGAHTKFRGKTLQIVKASPSTDAVPPAELQVRANRLLVGCGHNTALDLLEVQLEGKKRTSAADFIHGYRPNAG